MNTCLRDCKVLKMMQTSGQKLVRPELYMTHARKRSRYSSDQTVPAVFTNPDSMEIAVPLNKLVHFAQLSF